MATRNAPPQEYESDDDSYEVLDLTEYARRHHWWNRVFGHSSGPMVEKYSVATQIVMGGVSGWLSLVRSPIIGRSLLGKPRDRRGEVSRLILVGHAIKQRIDMLVEHIPQDTVKTWLLLASSVPFSESLLLSPLLRNTYV
ncbi:FUN14 domain-containing protein 1 isoform X2 [Physeter macrocephalus]|uniref:FUN14 domain-containing protein 1 isoform X2 n=1 Tax=Physeter macrocephalus TaxID=9755 RepID=A0A455ANZ0_PHYMC|nr:FUN14 domain-containing protein 1 isoform X2 [Physeter catodon]|eukprot:XP_028338380.1 FUN14 domain-containing protein 1 isoform X2 [Physeter catodon]